MQSEEGSCRREQLFSNKEEYWGIKKKKVQWDQARKHEANGEKIYIILVISQGNNISKRSKKPFIFNWPSILGHSCLFTFL